METAPQSPTEQSTSEYPFSDDQTRFIEGLIGERKNYLEQKLKLDNKDRRIWENIHTIESPFCAK